MRFAVGLVIFALCVVKVLAADVYPLPTTSTYPGFGPGSSCLIESEAWPKQLSCNLALRLTANYTLNLAVGIKGDRPGQDLFALTLGISTQPLNTPQTYRTALNTALALASFAGVLKSSDIGANISPELAGSIDLSTLSMQYPPKFPSVPAKTVISLTGSQLGSLSICLSNLTSISSAFGPAGAQLKIVMG
eukprot:Colp12_sorted_trinity150504_noHs@16056